MTNEIASVSKGAWPEVFFEEIEAPYLPAETALTRRVLAVADGLAGWANVYASRLLGLDLPANFGLVIMKLRNAAEIDGATAEDFSAAAARLERENPGAGEAT